MPRRLPLTQGYACPHCAAPHTSVRDSRSIDGRIRRRRVCDACGSKFSTLELPVHEVPTFAILNERARSVTSALNQTVHHFNTLRKTLRAAAAGEKYEP